MGGRNSLWKVKRTGILFAFLCIIGAFNYYVAHRYSKHMEMGVGVNVLVKTPAATSPELTVSNCGRYSLFNVKPRKKLGYHKARSSKYKCDSKALFPTGFDGECLFNVSSDLEYLPDARCVQSMPPVDWSEDRENMFAHIHKLQNPRECSNPHSSDLNEVPDKLYAHGDSNTSSPKWNLLGFLHHGYAYNLFVFGWNAGQHWANDVSVLVGNSKYRFSDVKCGKHWSCLWSPLSNCTINVFDAVVNDDKVLAYYGKESRFLSMEQLCRPNGSYNKATGRCECNEKHMPSRLHANAGCAPYEYFQFDKSQRKMHHKEVWESKDPFTMREVRDGDDNYFSQLAPMLANPEFSDYKNKISQSRAKRGFVWEHAHWLWYLHKDAPLRHEMDLFLSKLGFTKQKRTIGIHVRHGDSCHDQYQTHRKCLPLSVYMEKVKILENKYGKYDQIFLATDDPQVIKDSQKKFSSYKFVVQSIDRKIYDEGDTSGVDIRPEFNDPKIVGDIARDIWALAHCDAFIASFASSVAWVVYELMIARLGYYVPFISVDLPFLHEKNVGRFLRDHNV